MATEAEIEKLEADFRRLLAEASKHEEFDTPEKIEGWIVRTLTQEGYVLRNGIWQPGNN